MPTPIGSGMVDPDTGLVPEDLLAGIEGDPNVQSMLDPQTANAAAAQQAQPAEDKQQQDVPSPHARSEAILNQIQNIQNQKQGYRMGQNMDGPKEKQIAELLQLYQHVSQQESQDQTISRFDKQYASQERRDAADNAVRLANNQNTVAQRDAAANERNQNIKMTNFSAVDPVTDQPGLYHYEDGEVKPSGPVVPGSRFQGPMPDDGQQRAQGTAPALDSVLGATPDSIKQLRPYVAPQKDPAPKTEQMFQQPGGGIVGVTPGGGARNIQLPPGVTGPLQKPGVAQAPGAVTGVESEQAKAAQANVNRAAAALAAGQKVPGANIAQLTHSLVVAKSQQQAIIGHQGAPAAPQGGGNVAPVGYITKMQDGTSQIKTANGWQPYTGPPQ